MKRILTGDRPTGNLHLGHYLGTLKNRVKLQDFYECFFIIADLQVFTDHLQDSEKIAANVFEVACDYLGVGLKESNCFFIQSQVPELSELSMYFSFLVNISELKRNPTVKSEAEMYGVSNINLGFFSYPVSQAADILAFKADVVPCGQDQLPHIFQTREIVRIFNNHFGPIFKDPEELIGECPILKGIDGRKMSKSLGNTISFAQTEDETEKKILNMLTDEGRVRLKDPGNPQKCLAFSYLCFFEKDIDEIHNIENLCMSAGISCRDCKKRLSNIINDELREIRERRDFYHSDQERVWNILRKGNEKARAEASKTLEEVREAMGISYHS
jgi:tryptophanyl-tRNA synthetase